MSLRPALVTFVLVGASLARGALAAPETKAMTKEALAAAEVKALLPLLRSAVKEDYRRQAWYVATRVLVGEPKNPEAEAALKSFQGKELEEGRDPAKPWLATRDATFRKLGDLYAQFVRETQAAGGAAVDTFAYLERAMAYGTVAADALAAMESAGYGWHGTYGSVKKGLVETALGAAAAATGFPPEYDDAVLRHRCIWPDARVVEFGKTRLVSALSPDDTWRMVAVLTAEEALFVRTFGSKARDPAKDEDDHTDVVVVPDATLYGRLGDAFVPQDMRADFDRASSWYMPYRRRLFVVAPLRDNPWTSRDATICGEAVRPMIRRHLGAGTGSWLHGRGSWILDGFVGAFEGFVSKAPGEGEIDPARCWRLAAVRELFDRAAFISWADLFEMDRKQADDVATRELEFTWGGEARKAKSVAVPSLQATALVMAIWQPDTGKGVKRLAALIEELYKRNRLPDLDKALGLSNGKTVELVEAYIKALSAK